MVILLILVILVFVHLSLLLDECSIVEVVYLHCFAHLMQGLCCSFAGGKTSESQIVLGLLVSRDGYPLSYCIFNGSQYEGYTMLPIIDDFIQRFSLDDFVVVAKVEIMPPKNRKIQKG